MTNPSNSRGKLPENRAPLRSDFEDGRVSHDELLETARGVSAQDEQKIIERKKLEVTAAEVAVETETRLRTGVRRVFFTHAGAFVLGGAALTTLALIPAGTALLFAPLALWAIGLGAHGVWVARTQDRGVIRAADALAAARDDLDSYLSLEPSKRSVPPRAMEPSDPGDLRESDTDVRKRA